MSNPATWDLTYGIAGFVDGEYDYLKVTYPSSTSETYTFRLGGAAGTVVSVFTVTYTDSTKNAIDNVERTT